MVMALRCFMLSCGVSSVGAVAQVCTPDAQFDGTLELQGGATCSMMVSMLTDFTASSATCQAQIDTGGGHMMERAAYISMLGLSSCCSNGKTICTDHVPAPGTYICADANQFDAAITLQGGLTCSQMALSVQSFTANGAQCEMQIDMGGGDTVQLATYFSMMGLDGCCNNGKTICSDSLPAPGVGICSESSLFDGSVTLQQGDVTCSQMALSVQTLIADGTSCETQIDVGIGDLVARATYLSMMGLDACCSNGKTACSDFSDAAGAHVCEDADHFDGTISLGGPVTCSAQAATAFSHFGASSSCDAEVNMNGEIVSKAAFLTTLSPCCSNSKTVCSAAASGASGAQICANADQFDGTVSLQQGAMTCSMVAMYAAGSFDVSCEEQIDFDESTMSKAEYFDMMNLALCCQDGQVMCSAESTLPANSSDDSNTSVVSTILSGSPSFLRTQTIIGTNESRDVDVNGAALTSLYFSMMVAGLVAYVM